MKKVCLLLTGFLALSGSLFAQSEDKTGMEWVLDEPGEQVLFDPDYQGTSLIGLGFYPLDDYTGYSIYGSRYRKAKSNKNWGENLVWSGVPLGLAIAAWGFTVNGDGSQEAVAAIGTLAVLGASLGFGIPLWVKGQRELDWMLDDYARRYGPKPHTASLSLGATQNGVGLAFNF